MRGSKNSQALAGKPAGVFIPELTRLRSRTIVGAGVATLQSDRQIKARRRHIQRSRHCQASLQSGTDQANIGKALSRYTPLVKEPQ